MIKLVERTGLPVESFIIGEKAVIANPSLLIQSENQENDTFTVVATQLSLMDWKAAINDRTGRGYVMSNGDYARKQEETSTREENIRLCIALELDRYGERMVNYDVLTDGEIVKQLRYLKEV
ncbi:MULTISPECIES: hypothetical protein [unclassified Psychrobacillus]|uniref:hypothetical protein n=1 Tax=unclassified Psychrobacillus TaxID=2636677 RepID=UPI0030FC3011